MKTYLDTLSNEERFFRFGNSVRYPSKKEVALPIKLGQLETQLFVSVVDASIPLLIEEAGIHYKL